MTWNKPQLHISSVVDLQPLVAPVQNRPFFIKPNYGLWTSTYTDGSSAWVEWCRAEQFGDPDELNWHVITPDPGARVFVIDSPSDLHVLIRRYPCADAEQQIYSRFFCYVDFETMSRDYDAVHLTDAGQWATRYSEPSLYGWDCESTLWFRWCFTSIRALTTPAVER